MNSSDSIASEDASTTQGDPIASQVLPFLRQLWTDPGEVRELRILKHNRYGHNASGYFDSPEAMSEAVRSWDGKASIFVTENPVNPALIARANNRVVERATHTTGDADIVRRRWLLLDFDPVRPSGISATEREMSLAVHRAKDVYEFLKQWGWSEPFKAMSGNGAHLLYPIDLENTPEALALVNDTLHALAAKFDDEKVKIDTTVGNAARITALIGTMKVKGDDTEDRPHRRSRRLGTAAVGEPVPFELLRQLADQVPGKSQRKKSEERVVRLRQMLAAKGISYREQPPDIAGIVWLHVEECPFHNDGKPFECGVGEAPDGRLCGKCFHPEGDGKRWHDFKAALGLGTESVHKDAEGDDEFREKRQLLGDLIREGPKPIDWLLQPTLVRSRVHLVYGEPESGKTILVLSWMLEVIERGEHAVYVDEESGGEALVQLLIAMGADPDRLDECFHYFPFPEIGSEDYLALAEYCEEVRPALVGFDSLTDMLSVAGLQENNGDDVTGWMRAVAQRIARAPYRAAVILTDHISKDASNPRYSVASRAKKAKSDVLWRVEKKGDFDARTITSVVLYREKNRPGTLSREVTYLIGGDGNGRLLCELDENGSEATRASGENMSDGARKMLEALTAEGGSMLTSAIGQRFAISRQTVGRWGGELKSKGLAEHYGSGTTAGWRTVTCDGPSVTREGPLHTSSVTYDPPLGGYVTLDDSGPIVGDREPNDDRRISEFDFTGSTPAWNQPQGRGKKGKR